ncbi:MAG TPA: hypothetical protein VGN52_09970 [Burkholderiales bacterium]
MRQWRNAHFFPAAAAGARLPAKTYFAFAALKSRQARYPLSAATITPTITRTIILLTHPQSLIANRQPAMLGHLRRLNVP